MRKLTRGLSSLVTICALNFSVITHSAQSGGQDVIGQARGTYYNLKSQGFYGLKANIEPNWEVTLGPTASKENLKIFRAVRFTMTADSNLAVTVSHEVVDTEKARVEPYIRQIHENVRRLVAAFFGTWARFMVNSPFPQDKTQIRIDNSGREYFLFYTADSADVMLTMTKDLLITEWKFTGATAKRTIKPLFEKTDEGLVLIGYKTIFEPVGEGIKTTLDFTVEYHEVGGIKLPDKIEIRGLHGSEPVAAELSFNHYVLNPRPAN